MRSLVARRGIPLARAAVYKVRDLADCEVVTSAGERLGRLVDVWPTGGNDVFVVREGGREMLLPALKRVVRNIDVTLKRIEVVLPPGLREIYETA